LVFKTKPRSGGVFGYNGIMKKRVKTKWGINISGEASFLVKTGEKVLEGQILVRVKDKKLNSFDFSGFLGKISPQKLLDLNEKFTNNWVNTGELICMTGGIFPNKICFPISGNFLGLDEFGVLRIEEKDEIEKEILSPVNSKVLKVDKDKISLEFEVYEFKGDGIVGGKVWGRGEIKLINEVKDLNFNLKGSLLFTNNLSKTFLLKAEVVGVTGIVTKIKQDEILTELPVLFLDEGEWNDLFRSEGKVENFLMNSRVGRLLMVLE
jgi:hypothetical protein